MRKTVVKMILLLLLTANAFTAGCEFLGGAAVGAAAASGGYEYSAKKQLDRLEEDYKAGNITKEEYEARKKQIDEGSIIY